MKYLRDNIKYPSMAKDAGISGNVVLTFVINENGTIEDESIKVIKDVGGGCSIEAVRVVRNMPAWKPGKNNGKTVKIRKSLPIRFLLK